MMMMTTPEGRLTTRIWTAPRPLVGMVHLPPLPGAPGWRRESGGMDALIERVLTDARTLADGGMDGVLLENFNDAPFYPGRVPPETVAAMAIAAAETVRAVAVPVGVNVLRNDTAAALAIAVTAGTSFIRVNVHTGAMLTDQGWLTGRAHQTLRRRAELGAGERPAAVPVDERPVAILADVFVKHATPPSGANLAQTARDTWHRGLADALIVTGHVTGGPIDPALPRAVKEAVPEAPVWLGSGITSANVRSLLPLADGAIIGSSLMRGGLAGNPVDPARVGDLVRTWSGC